jgi:hypothetical protein
MEKPNYLLKIIPHVDGSPRILELVDYRLEDIVVKGAWSGPATLDLMRWRQSPSFPCVRSSPPRISSLTSPSDWARSFTTISRNEERPA